MKIFYSRTVKAFASAVLFAVISGALLFPHYGAKAADDKPNYSKKFKVVKAKGTKGVINDKVLQLITKPAVAFHPFEAVNLETKAAYKPGEKVTLPDGRKFDANDYFNQLNMVERGLNQIGYSLRDPDDMLFIAKTPAALINKIHFDAARNLKNSHKQIRGQDALKFNYYSDPKRVFTDFNASPEKAFPGFDRSRVRRTSTEAESNYGKVSFLKYSPSSAPSYDGAGYTSEPIVGVAVGDPQLFSVFLNGKIEASTKPGIGTIGANISAGASVFGSSLEFVSVGGTVQTGGNPKGNVYVNVLGVTVYNPEKGVNATVVGKNASIVEDAFSNPLEWGVQIPFSLGPIPMLASFSVQGDIGLGYNYLAAEGGYSHCQLKPYVRSSLTATIEANLGIAGGGGGITLELLDDDLTLTAYNLSALKSPALPETGLPHHRHQLMATNNVTALKGKGFAFVWFYVPKFGIPPWKKKQINWPIYESAAGYTANGLLFNKVNSDGDIY